MKIEIFEPNLCCSTGVCGPTPDKDLVNLQEMVQTAKKAGYTIQRYAINQQPLAFTSNDVIRQYIRENGTNNFPVTLIDGEIIKEKAYPSWTELSERIPELKQIKPTTTVLGTF
ncbi:MAG: arsenite efflux transporter metallochaperone ArsD [Bacteroidetes bacterium]|nr:arsenite efflux transporter metallochaperone ArsD [Bacteroidota bacterium]MCH8523486.1 arsenite efflux transporter metallochaperone ArsD [Balneolales bacterium]